MTLDQQQKISFIILGAVLIAALIVVKPLLIALITAAVLSYIFYPVHKWLRTKVRSEAVSAMIITIAIVLALVIPSAFVLNTLRSEGLEGYRQLSGYLSGAEGDCEYSAACAIQGIFDTFNISPEQRPFIQENLGTIVGLFLDMIRGALLALPIFFMQAFVILFVMYYLLKDGSNLLPKFKELLPLKKSHQNELFERFTKVTYAVVFGTLVVALLQGILAGIGYWVAGVESPLTWGIITFLVSLIPFVGPVIIWAPMSLMMIANGYFGSESQMIITGIGLFIYGAVVVSGIDNILKPRLIGSHAQVHPVLILLGVIGGLTMFGIIGIVVGPVILSLADTAIDLIAREQRARSH